MGKISIKQINHIYDNYLYNEDDKFFKDKQSKLIYYLNKATSCGDILNKLNIDTSITRDKLRERIYVIYSIISTDVPDYIIKDAENAKKNLKILYNRLKK